MSGEDLTKIGNVPGRKQYSTRKKINKENKYIKNTYCVDHTGFRENCPNCLMLVVFKLAERLEELEEILNKEITEATTHYPSRHPHRRGR